MNAPFLRATVPLGEVADFINGYAFKPADWSSEGLPIVRIQNLTGSGSELNRTQLAVPEKYLVNRGDLLVSWSASLGVFEWPGPLAIVNQHIFKVVPNLKKIDLNYLRHAIDASIHEMERFTHGSTMKHINRKEFLAHRIPLSPLDEQRRIAAILDKADALRRKRKRAIDLVDGLAQSVFLEMFGHPGDAKAKFVQRPLGDIAELINGDRSSNYPSGDDLVSSGILFLNTSNITPEGLDLSAANFITEKKFAALSRGKLCRNDIVITLRGSLGQAAIFDCEAETGFINAQMMIIRPKKDVNARFLLQALQLDEMVLHFKRIGSGSAVPQLTAKQMSEIEIPLPNLAAQKEFGSRRESVRKSRLAAACDLREMESLFSSLQHRAFSGQL